MFWKRYRKSNNKNNSSLRAIITWLQITYIFYIYWPTAGWKNWCTWPYKETIKIILYYGPRAGGMLTKDFIKAFPRPITPIKYRNLLILCGLLGQEMTQMIQIISHAMSMKDRMLLGWFVPWQLMVNNSL